MLGSLKQYLTEHRDVVWSIVLVALIDQFFLNGALKSRISSILEGVCKKAEQKVNDGTTQANG